MSRGLVFVAGMALLALAAPARADDLAALTVEPWAARDGTARPYRVVVTLLAERAIEAVVDRRLLAFEIQPTGSRRRFACRHPRAPRHAAAARTRTLQPGEAWREWVDLRMYCTGRAASAIAAGAEVRPSYGWRRATSRLWVARAPDTASRDWTGGIRPAALALGPVEPVTTSRVAPEPGPAPIDVVLSPASASSATSLSFRVSVRARTGAARLYLRPDSFSFRVSGPSADFACRLEPWGGAPIADLYRRVTPRVGWGEVLDARVFCPDHAFDRAGVYEVTPKLRLPYDGAEWGLDAVSGRFAGPPAAIRILDDPAGYVEQAIIEPGDGGE